jgi:hypothetical protein
MPIIFKSKLDSAVANATFLLKDSDDGTAFKLSLTNTDAESGASITNTQREINLSKKVIFGEAPKLDGDTLTPNELSLNQEFRLIGNGAPVTLDLLPFGSSQVVLDGAEIKLFGHDDTFTVRINHNDSQYGCLLNGDAILKKGFMIKLVYNDELERYIEETRNF